MLKFILGGAKTGKSFYTFEKIKKLSQKLTAEGKSYDTEQIILIVPEQFSYETERALFELVGGNSFLNIKVTSFTRLAIEIFQLFGGVSGNYADDCAKIVIMNKAIKSCLDNGDLTIYNKSAKYPSFASKMVTTIDELKKAGISYEDLTVENELSNDKTNEYLNNKIKDIANIYRMYEAEFNATNHIDITDDLTRAIEVIRNNIGFLEHKHIFIDEFKSFTSPELDFLSLMLIYAEDVYVTLCIDNEREVDELSPFASILETKKSIKNLAQKYNVKIDKNIIVEDVYTKSNTSEEMQHIQKNAFANELERFKGKNNKGENNNVKAVVCKNTTSELDYVLATIKHLVANDEYKYSDIAVIARNITDYEDIYENLFNKYEVPVFYDKTVSVTSMNIFRFVQSFLNCVATRTTTENLLNMLKSDLLAFNSSDIDNFENYLYIWNIKSSKQLETPFTQNPSGLKSEFSPSDTRKLEKINAIRLFCTENINEFKKMDKSNGFKYCSALMTIIEKMGIKAKLEKIINIYRITDDEEQVESLTRSFEIFNEILVTIGNVIGSSTVNEKKFNELFNLVSETYDMGSVPQTLDSVTLGTADRIRLNNKKVVFLISVNEGEFPLTPVNTSLLSNKEREILGENKIKIPNIGIDKLKEERFIAYKSLTSPLEKLYLTARTNNSKGEKLKIASIFEELKILFGDEVVTNYYDLTVDYYCHNNSTLLNQYLINEKNIKVSNKSLLEVLNTNVTTKNKLEIIEKIKNKQGFEISDPDIAKALFGEAMTLSASKIDKYFECPFLYFCSYGIKIDKLQKAEINPMQSGNIIHYVLENIVKSIDFDKELAIGFDEAKTKIDIQNEIQKFITEEFGGTSDKEKRFLYLCERAETPVLNIVKRLYEEFKISKFRPIGFEEKINNDSNIKPLEYTTKNGRATIVGTIDRVDYYINDETKQKYIRVIDYKSGKMEFKLNKVLNGRNFQMLIYLQSIIKGGINQYEGFEPAGLLYMPSGYQDLIDIKKLKSGEDPKVKYLSQYQMNGLIVDNPENPTTLEAMEIREHYVDAKGTDKEKPNQYLPAIKLPTPKNKPPYKIDKSLVTPNQLEEIDKYINNKIVEMVDSLLEGKIPAYPLDKITDSEKISCDYCDYIDICGRSTSDKDNIRPFYIEKDEEILREEFAKENLK